MKSETIELSSCQAIEPERGFTLIEMMTVLAVMIILSIVAVVNLAQRRSKSDLDNATRQIVATLREAESRSVSQQSSTIWGVRLSNTTATAAFYALFANSYAPSTTVGYYRLPPSVQYMTSSIAQGSSLDITFAQISGSPSTSTSITLKIAAGGPGLTTSTITVNASGLITY